MPLRVSLISRLYPFLICAMYCFSGMQLRLKRVVKEEKSSPDLAVSNFLTTSPAVFDNSVSTEQIVKATNCMRYNRDHSSTKLAVSVINGNQCSICDSRPIAISGCPRGSMVYTVTQKPNIPLETLPRPCGADGYYLSHRSLVFTSQLQLLSEVNHSGKESIQQFPSRQTRCLHSRRVPVPRGGVGAASAPTWLPRHAPGSSLGWLGGRILRNFGGIKLLLALPNDEHGGRQFTSQR